MRSCTPFARYDFPHRAEPRRDIDRVSPGVVKVLDEQAGTRQGRYADMPWEPKAGFSTLADNYERLSAASLPSIR